MVAGSPAAARRRGVTVVDNYDHHRTPAGLDEHTYTVHNAAVRANFSVVLPPFFSDDTAAADRTRVHHGTMHPKMWLLEFSEGGACGSGFLRLAISSANLGRYDAKINNQVWACCSPCCCRCSPLSTPPGSPSVWTGVGVRLCARAGRRRGCSRARRLAAQGGAQGAASRRRRLQREGGAGACGASPAGTERACAAPLTSAGGSPRRRDSSRRAEPTRPALAPTSSSSWSGSSAERRRSCFASGRRC